MEHDFYIPRPLTEENKNQLKRKFPSVKFEDNYIEFHTYNGERRMHNVTPNTVYSMKQYKGHDSQYTLIALSEKETPQSKANSEKNGYALLIGETGVYLGNVRSLDDIEFKKAAYDQSEYVIIPCEDSANSATARYYLYTPEGKPFGRTQRDYSQILSWIDEDDTFGLRVFLDFEDIHGLFDESGNVLELLSNDKTIEEFESYLGPYYKLKSLNRKGFGIINVSDGKIVIFPVYGDIFTLQDSDYYEYSYYGNCAECFVDDIDHKVKRKLIIANGNRYIESKIYAISEDCTSIEEVEDPLLKAFEKKYGSVHFEWDDDACIIKVGANRGFSIVGPDGKLISDKLYDYAGLKKDVFEDCEDDYGRLMPLKRFEDGKYNFFYNHTKSFIFSEDEVLDDVADYDYKKASKFVDDEMTLIPVKRNGKCNFMVREMLRDKTLGYYDTLASDVYREGPFIFHENAKYYPCTWVDNIRYDECMYGSGRLAYVVEKDGKNYLFVSGRFAVEPSKYYNREYYGFGVLGYDADPDYVHNCIVIAEMVNGRLKYSVKNTRPKDPWMHRFDWPSIVDDADEIYDPSSAFPVVKKDGKYNYINVERSKLVFNKWYDDAEYSEYLEDEYVTRLRVKDGDKVIDLDEYGDEIK